MFNRQFNIGDVVQLKSGGPRLTVTKVQFDDGSGNVNFFGFAADGKVIDAVLPQECLNNLKYTKEVK